MSQIYQLQSEIESLVNKSGYKKSKKLLCPIVKIVSMRHSDVDTKQIYKIAKSFL